MEMKELQCQDHGGTFSIPRKAGRPPTFCGGKYPVCSKEGGIRKTDVPAVKPNIQAKVGKRQAALSTGTNAVVQMASAERVSLDVLLLDKAGFRARKRAVAKGTKMPPLPRTVPAARPLKRKASEEASAVVVTVNHALPLAQKAKAHLVDLGWTVAGRGGVENTAEGTYFAEITAHRGTELLVIRWTAFASGEITTDQNYSLWDVEKPITAKAAKPAHKLGFEPDELSDGELIRELAGRKITWWNRIGSSTESGAIGAKVQIEHTFNSTGDELPGDRIIKFADHEGGGFRALRVAQLLSVK